MILKFLGSLIPDFVKKQIYCFFQALTGYSPEIQSQHKLIEMLTEKKLILEHQVRRLEEVSKRLAAAVETVDSRLNAKTILDVESDAVSCDGALIPSEAVQIIIREGFDRYPGGIYNPGHFTCAGKSYLLARGEKHMEIERARDASKMMRGSAPLLTECSPDFTVQSMKELQLVGFPSRVDFRAEDFRVFIFQEQVYAHHSLIQFPPYFRYRDDKTYFSKQVISRVDIEKKQLVYCGAPALDRNLALIEKNWLYLEHDGEVYLFYGFSPFYLVQKLVSWGRFEFKTFIDMPLRIFGLHHLPYVSFSSNPVEYDEKHYLLFVHARRGKQILDYLHWGVLISKTTLKPVFISKKPVLRGGNARGVYPHVIFITAVIPSGRDFDIIMGEGDYYSSVAKLERSLFEKNLISIE
ncbi:MAG TPA: hypothetical protein PLY88_06140 [Candidatus Omnitrophota bacterium]|nr:hypothetical protein [Candidatus Omnitrophota bacterium]HRK62110.1 hypothetical protein [Candidatus Omnitrophota bacterium]